MAGANRYRFKQPLDNWSIREKLALACSVLRSGDQNWVSVSRTIKPFGDPDRSEQWFSQRNCAQQYAELLETTDTPKRKRTEKEKEVVETPQLVIARKLTLERIEQLREVIKRQQQEYYKLKEEIEQINAGHFDKNLTELVQQIKQEEAEEVAKLVKEEKGDGDAGISKPPSTPSTPTPAAISSDASEVTAIPEVTTLNVTEVQIKIEKEDESMDTEDISVVEETVVDDTPVILLEPKPEPVTVATNSEPPVVPKQETPTKQPKLEIKEPTTPTRTPPPKTPPLRVTPVKTPPVKSVPGKSTPLKVPPIKIVSVKAASVRQHIQEEKVPLIKTEPADDIEVDVMASETSDEGPHMGTEVSTESATEEKKAVTPVTMEPPLKVKQEITEEPIEVEEPDSANTSTISVTDTSAPVSKELDDNSPMSPASSIASHEPESSKKDTPRKGKSNRGRKPGKSNRAQEKREERPLASELDTSDDDERSLISLRHGLHSPAPITHDESDMDEKQYKMWKKSIILVWRGAANHKFANVFMHPVKEDIAPGYKKIVLRPMDLQTIKRKIESGEIRSTVEFQRDIMLMFTNAIMYNSSDHDVYKMAMTMYNDVMSSIEQYVSTQVILPSEATPRGKILRQSRRSENAPLSGSERSDKEEDIKKRRQSIEVDGGKVKKRKT